MAQPQRTPPRRNVVPLQSSDCVVHLKPGRDRSLRQHHPWIFSGAIASIDGNPTLGDTVILVAADGTFLCRGAYSPESQIRVRAWSFDPAAEIDAAFFAEREQTSLARRAAMLDAAHRAC